jgi:hypothetical protein
MPNLFAILVRINMGVAEKHDFRGIQRKILQVSDFVKKNGIRTPTPWGYCGGHCKNVC